MKIKKLLLSLISVAFTSLAFADIYSCPDTDGKNMISNTKLNNKCRNVTADSEAGMAKLEKERRKIIGKTVAQLKKIIEREPDQIVESITAGGTVEKWLYKYETIILVNGVVTEVIAIK